MDNILVPFVLIAGGVMGLTVYVLTIAVKQMSNQITKTNEKLMVLIASQSINPEATRALTALSKPPQGKMSGISTQKKEEPKKKDGMSMTVGVH